MRDGILIGLTVGIIGMIVFAAGLFCGMMIMLHGMS
jgi:hypothetical protein